MISAQPLGNFNCPRDRSFFFLTLAVRSLSLKKKENQNWKLSKEPRQSTSTISLPIVFVGRHTGGMQHCVLRSKVLEAVAGPCAGATRLCRTNSRPTPNRVSQNEGRAISVVVEVSEALLRVSLQFMLTVCMQSHADMFSVVSCACQYVSMRLQTFCSLT